MPGVGVIARRMQSTKTLLPNSEFKKPIDVFTAPSIGARDGVIASIHIPTYFN